MYKFFLHIRITCIRLYSGSPTLLN